MVNVSDEAIKDHENFITTSSKAEKSCASYSSLAIRRNAENCRFGGVCKDETSTTLSTTPLLAFIMQFYAAKWKEM